MHPDYNTRLAQLESRLRRQKWVSFVSLGLAAAAASVAVTNRGGAAIRGTTVEANRFVLRDAKGEQRGLWEVDAKDQAYLRVAPVGAPGAFLGESPEGTEISLFHPSGSGRIFLQANREDAQILGTGASQENFRVGTNGNQLILSNGTAAMESGVNSAGPWMKMSRDGKPRIALGRYDLTDATWRLRFLNPDNTAFHDVPAAAPPP